MGVEDANPDLHVTVESLDAIIDKIDNLTQNMEGRGVEIDENLQVPSEAYEILREVLAYGASKRRDKWWKHSIKSHIDSARLHIDNYRYNDYPEHSNLNHAFCHLMMAAVIQHRENMK